MSAFVVSKHQIDSIVTAALAYRLEGFDRRSATDVGRTLWGENVRSVAHRYPGDREDTRDAERVAEVYVYRAVPVPTVAQAAKLIDCLEYQSCEQDDWSRSEAAALLGRIRGGAPSVPPGLRGGCLGGRRACLNRRDGASVRHPARFTASRAHTVARETEQTFR